MEILSKGKLVLGEKYTVGTTYWLSMGKDGYTDFLEGKTIVDLQMSSECGSILINFFKLADDGEIINALREGNKSENKMLERFKNLIPGVIEKE